MPIPTPRQVRMTVGGALSVLKWKVLRSRRYEVCPNYWVSQPGTKYRSKKELNESRRRSACISGARETAGDDAE